MEDTQKDSRFEVVLINDGPEFNAKEATEPPNCGGNDTCVLVDYCSSCTNDTCGLVDFSG